MSTTDSSEKEQFMHIININNSLLLNLINDILDLSKIESEGLKLKKEKFDLTTYFDELVAAMQAQVSDPSIKLRIIHPYKSCILTLDKIRLGQILTNFLSNAIKHTHCGFIEIKYAHTDGNIHLSVKDTGTGISEKDKEKIFHHFEKVNHYVQGTGLGLSICKAIVKAMEGKIGFDSEVGVGSIFWVTLPCEAVIEQ